MITVNEGIGISVPGKLEKRGDTCYISKRKPSSRKLEKFKEGGVDTMEDTIV